MVVQLKPNAWANEIQFRRSINFMLNVAQLKKVASRPSRPVFSKNMD